MRKLVSIQKIKEVKPIKDADLIEKVSFEDIGWECVAKKGEFSPGDLCVYFEIDSFLPKEDKRYSFLEGCCSRKMYTGREGYRLKTAKMRGEVSQGMALPLSLFPEVKEKEIGTDLTEKLNVIKWEQDPGSAFEIAGDFPGFIEKSDQDRIQILMDYFEKYKDVEFEESMKLDGTSSSFYFVNGELGLCSRNNKLKMIDRVPSWKVIKEKGLDIALKELGLNIALQGELMGPKIQGNREKLDQLEIFFYNIFDINKSRFFKPSERNEIFEKLNERVKEISGKEIKQVPILRQKVKIFEECTSLEDILSVANGKSINHKHREGNVYKSLEYIENNRIVQFKVISNNFLLKGGS